MRKKIIRAVLVAAILVPSWFVYKLFFPSVEDVMRDFYLPASVSGRMESWTADPLRLHADLVKMHVIAAIADKNMKDRRYAIGFLGECGIVEALPALRAILGDATENDVYRGDALESIFRIAPEEGRALAERCKENKGFLGHIAWEIVAGEMSPGDWYDPDDDPPAECRRR